jgi:hypothetical protein
MRKITGRGGLRGGMLFALSLAAAVLVYFFPFFFQGKHVVPFHFESSQATGIPEGGAPPSIYRRFPGNDYSPIFIHYPNAAFVGSCLRSGEFPTWNPYVGCGTPAMGSGQVYPFSPFLWPFYAAPSPWVYSLGLVLGLLFSALGFYLWLGRFGFPNWQRILGALIWGFNPFSLRILIFSNLWAAWWLGWLLWSWDRTMGSRKGGWWLPALFIAGMVYCGHPEEAVLLASGSLVYALAAWALGERAERPKPASAALRILGIAGLAGALTAVHTLPVLAPLGEVFTYKYAAAERVTAGSYRLLDLLNPRTEVYLSPVLWAFFYLGLSSLGRSGAGRRLWAVAILLLYAMAVCFRPPLLGSLASLVTLGGLVPGIYARTLFWCAVSCLAAAGAGRILGEGGDRWATVRLFLLGPASFAGLSWATYQEGAMVHLLLLPHLMAVYAAAAALLTVAATGLPHALRRGAALAGLVLVVLLPLGEFGPGIRFYEIFNREDPAAAGPPAIADLRKRLASDRSARFSASMPTGTHAPDLSPNLASLWRVRDPRIVDALVERRFATAEVAMLPKKPPFVATWFAFQGVPARDLGLLGVRFFAVPEEPKTARFRWEEIPSALPRAYVVHNVAASRDEEDSLRLWKDLYPTDAAYDTATVEGWTGGAAVGRASAGEKVEWLEDGTARVRLRATTASGGVLVLLDTYASGWKAEVDGRPARIYPANLAFRAVEVPPGTHEVDFRYAPLSVTLGLALSGAGWLLVGALALGARFIGAAREAWERRP